MRIFEYIKDNKKKFIIIGSGVIILAILITGVFLIKAANNNSNKSSEEEITSEEEAIISGEIEEDPQPQGNQQDSGVQVDAGNLNAADNNYGVDVSKWQGEIDWVAVKASGIEYAMIRVGYRTEGNGTICEDSYAKYNLQQATKAGIKVGVYFFSTAVSTSEAKEEAAWVTDFIAKYKITYPVVYNCEGFTQSDSRMYQLTNDERTNNAITFLNYIKNQGYTPMFYANAGELTASKSWNTDTLTDKYKIWVAQYPGTAFSDGMTSSYSGTHSMWQYTNKGLVNGISGNVDLNVSYLGELPEAEPKDPSGYEEVEAPTQTTSTYDPYQNIVNDSVTAKIETNLRTAASTADDTTIVFLLKNGEFVNRIAIGTNGWSKVLYNGQTLYAKTNNLTTSTETASTQTTTTADPYTSVNEQVTAKIETWLRTVASTADDSTKVYLLKNGEFVQRTGTASTGWSRVVYNGQTLYAKTSYLTTSTETTAAQTTAAADPYTSVNEQVTAKIETWLRTVASTADDTTKVYLLKNGEFVQRTGTASTGWSRVVYNGQTLYAKTSYLTTSTETTTQTP